MSPRRWVLTPSITAGFALTFLLLLGAGRGGYEAVNRATNIAHVNQRDRRVLEQSQRVVTRLGDAEAAQRGYLLTGAERDLGPYQEAREALPADLETLGELVRDNPDRQRLVALLTPAVRARLSELGDILEIRRREGAEAAIHAFSMNHESENLGHIRAIVDELQRAEASDIQRHRVVAEDERVVTRVLILVATLLGALLAGLTLVALNRQTRRRMVAETERERLVRVEATHAEAARASIELARAAEELRLREADFHAAFIHGPLGKAKVDPNGRFLRVNPCFCAMLGYEEAELLAKTFGDVSAPDDIEEQTSSFRSALASEMVQHSREKRYVRKDGTPIWVQLDVAIIRDAAGRALHAMVAIRDIARRKQAEAEREELLRITGEARAEAERAADRLRAAQEQAESANRAKDEFLAVLSHELRSPLHAMVGWLSILKKGVATGRNVDRAIETIERNVRLQTQLVNDLLDVSRIVSGKLEIEEKPVDLAMIVHSALDTARPAAAAQGVALACAVAPLPDPVLGDEQRLLQMTLNVVTNAVKFTPHGGRVMVTLTCTDGEAILVVADTGVGIDPDFLPHVFAPFRQADATSTRHHGGLGIGLAIAKTLAELHGGRIDVRSEGSGAGSTFSIRLPIRTAAFTLPAPLAAADDGPSALAGLRVLLLEDDPDGREALRLALEQTGAEVHGCGSADEARRLMETVAPDVIVSDVGMPGENGYDFVRGVRARAGDYVPAIAITGFASAQDREEAARSGFDAHLAKPVNADQLIAMLQDLVRLSGPRWPRSGVLPLTARRSGVGEHP